MADCRYFPECQRCNEVGDSWIPCSGGADGIQCDAYEPMPDVGALLALAEEAKKCAWYFGLNHDNDELKDRLEEAAADFSDFARRIREACGEGER